MLEPIFERFTDRARRVLVCAQEEARALGHPFIGTEHILLGMLAEREGLAAKALAELGVDLDDTRRKVRKVIGPVSSVPTGSPPFTPRARKVLELAGRESSQLGRGYIGTEHLLLGLVREGGGIGVQVLGDLGADSLSVRNKVVELLSAFASPPADADCPLHVAVPLVAAEQTVRRFVEAFVAAWPTGDATVLAGFFSEDAAYVNGPLAPVRGREAITASLAQMMELGGEVNCEIVHLLADGPFVMSERIDYWKSEGRSASLRVAGIFEIREGLISAWRDYFDPDEFTRQLGS